MSNKDNSRFTKTKVKMKVWQGTTLLLALFPVCGLGTELCQDKVPKFKESIPEVTTIQAGQIAYLTSEIYCVNNRLLILIIFKKSDIVFLFTKVSLFTYIYYLLV